MVIPRRPWIGGPVSTLQPSVREILTVEVLEEHAAVEVAPNRGRRLHFHATYFFNGEVVMKYRGYMRMAAPSSRG